MTPYDVAQKFFEGVISEKDLIDALVGWDYSPGGQMDGYDTLLPAFDENSVYHVTRAFIDGLIDAETYDEILTRLESKIFIQAV